MIPRSRHDRRNRLTASALVPAMAESVVLRGGDEAGALSGGRELAEPGVVQLPPGGGQTPGTAPAGPLPMWCGLACEGLPADV